MKIGRYLFFFQYELSFIIFYLLKIIKWKVVEFVKKKYLLGFFFVKNEKKIEKRSFFVLKSFKKGHIDKTVCVLMLNNVKMIKNMLENYVE